MKNNFIKILAALIISTIVGFGYNLIYGKNMHKLYIISTYKNIPEPILEESISQFFNTHYANNFIIKSSDSLNQNTIKTVVFIEEDVTINKIAKQLFNFMQSSSIAYNFCKHHNKSLLYKIEGIYEVNTSYNTSLWNSIAISVLTFMLFLIIIYYPKLFSDYKEKQ